MAALAPAPEKARVGKKIPRQPRSRLRIFIPDCLLFAPTLEPKRPNAIIRVGRSEEARTPDPTPDPVSGSQETKMKTQSEQREEFFFVPLVDGGGMMKRRRSSLFVRSFGFRGSGVLGEEERRKERRA